MVSLKRRMHGDRRSKGRRSLVIEQRRREAVESYIEQLIELLDAMDGDENMESYLSGFEAMCLDEREAEDENDEDGGDREPNGDESDTGFTDDEGFFSWGGDGSGSKVAEAMVKGLTKLSKRPRALSSVNAQRPRHEPALSS